MSRSKACESAPAPISAAKRCDPACLMAMGTIQLRNFKARWGMPNRAGELRPGECAYRVIVVPLRVELPVRPEGTKQIGHFDVVDDVYTCIAGKRVEIVDTKG